MMNHLHAYEDLHKKCFKGFYKQRWGKREGKLNFFIII
ncbi:hypothetical protein pah_c029o007 [Parachlamydia acanthamoebae str. Hall's coccus]|nr:hypothetical protein pah_c029o007 [Parachlamydia acanthamoebae str. Hall's coccus]